MTNVKSIPPAVFAYIAGTLGLFVGLFYQIHKFTLAIYFLCSAVVFFIIAIFQNIILAPHKDQIKYLKHLCLGEKRLLRSPILDAHLDDKRANRIIEVYEGDADANALLHANILILLCDYGNGMIQYKIDDFVVSYFRKEKNLKLLT